MAVKKQYQVSPTLTQDNFDKINALCVMQKRTRNNMAAVLIDEALKMVEKDIVFKKVPGGGYSASPKK
jgi:hypothetical protein